MERYLSDLLCLLKNVLKSYSFDVYFENNFRTTTSCTDLRKYITFKVVKQLILIGAMIKFTKLNLNLFMEERLKVLKKIREKCVTVMNKTSKIYGAC